MICNFKCHWPAEMTPFTWVPYTWALQSVNQPKWCSTLVVSTWPSPQLFATIKPPETSNSRNTTHYRVPSCKETNWTRDARPKPTTCINLTLIRFFRKPHQSWLTAPPNCKDSSGKITHASSLWATPQEKQVWFNLRCNWKTINVHISNSLLCTNPKVSEITQMVFSDCLLTKIKPRKSFTTYGLLKTTVSSIME